MTFDDSPLRYIDHEAGGYSQAVPAIYCGVEDRKLLCFPSDPAMRTAVPYEALNPILPREKWCQFNRTRYSVPILDQNGKGSCTGHGATSALMLARSIEGQPFELLSAPFLYAQINGGWDNGSSPADAAKVLVNTGVCLMSEFPEPNYLKSRIPAAAYETAKRFRVAEGGIYSCSTFDELVTAMIFGFAGFTTIRVGGGFNNLSRDGIVPVARGAGNHCIALGERLIYVNGKWYVEFRNSWTTQWGLQGRAFMGEEHVLAQGQWFECYVVKSATDDPQTPWIPRKAA